MLWPNGLISKKRQSKCAAAVISSFFFFFFNDKRCSQDSLLKKQIRHSAVPPSMTPLRNREVSNSCAMMTTVVGCQSAFHNKNQRPCFASYLSA